MFFRLYSHMVYKMISIFTSQGSDRGIPPAAGQKTVASRKEVNMIVIVQFKYVKMLCYYILLESILVSLDNFFYGFYARCCKENLPIIGEGPV